MSAEVTFLSGMIVGVDEDGIVGTSRHTCFAADADRFIEIHNAVGALEHRGGRTSGHTRRVRALVAPGDLMRSPCLRKDTYVDVFDVGARDANRHDIFRFTGGGAGVAADATRVVDYLGPLHPGI